MAGLNLTPLAAFNFARIKVLVFQYNFVDQLNNFLDILQSQHPFADRQSLIWDYPFIILPLFLLRILANFFPILTLNLNHTLKHQNFPIAKFSDPS